LDDWTIPRRFTIAAQSRLQDSRVLGTNQGEVVATDPAGDAAESRFDLTTLSVTQDRENWYFGFQVPDNEKQVETRYLLYIDTDQKLLSGGAYDPTGCKVGAADYHRPEFVVEINWTVFDSITHPISESRTYLHQWGGQKWLDRLAMVEVEHVALIYNQESGYAEVRLRKTYLALPEHSWGISVALISTPFLPVFPMDYIPGDNTRNQYDSSGRVLLTHYASISGNIPVIQMPFQTQYAGSQISAVFPRHWQVPTGVAVSGYAVRVAKNYAMETIVFESQQSISATLWQPPFYLNGDGIYYWQIRALNQNKPVSGWSTPMPFHYMLPIVGGGTVSIEYGVPLFQWTPGFRADAYQLQVANDANFSAPMVSTLIQGTHSFTPMSVNFQFGKLYYWRLRARYDGKFWSAWREQPSFSVQKADVTGLVAIPQKNYPQQKMPTLCWGPLVKAYQYRVEIARTAGFTQPVHMSAITRQNCYTPARTGDDGLFYWRVTALDGQGAVIGISVVKTLEIQRPSPAPIDPLKYTTEVPLFQWEAVEGAAGYRIQILDLLTSNLLYEQDIYGMTHHIPSWSEPMPFQPGYYKWRVAAIDADGSAGPFSQAVHIAEPQPFTFLPFVRR
jgi:hypothetical protein